MEALGSSKRDNDNFLVQGSILAIASILSRLIGLLYRIPLNNTIGTEGAGIYSATFELYNNCLIISSYGIPTAVSKLVAAKMEKKEYQNCHRILIGALLVSGLAGAIVTGVLFMGADFFSMALYDNPRIALPLKVLAPNLFIFSIMGVLRGYFQGKGTMIPTSVSQILEQIVNAIISLVAAYYFMVAHSVSADIAAYGAAGGTLGTVMGSCASLVFLGFVFFIYRPIQRRQMRRDQTGHLSTYTRTVKLILLTTIPIILSQLVYNISGLIDISLFHKIMGAKGVLKEERDALLGIYLGQYKLLTTVPISIATAIGAAIIPSIVSVVTRNNYREVKRKIHTAIKFNMIIAIPSAVGLGVLAKPILMMIFSSNSTQELELSTMLMQLGAIVVIFVALSTISSAILQGIDMVNIPAYHSAIALVIHVIVVVLLLKFTALGLLALVFGYIVFALIVCILNWMYIARVLDYRQEIIKTFVIEFFASVLMGVAAAGVYAGVHWLIPSNAFAVLVSIAVAVIVYFLMLFLLKAIDESDLKRIPKGDKLLPILKKLHVM